MRALLTESAVAVGVLPIIRELPPEEWSRLLAFQPFDTQGLPPTPTSRIMVAEVGGPGGAIVGYWGIFMAIHIEPLWIAPEYRKRPGVVRRMWRGIQSLLADLGADTAFACIFEADAPNKPLAQKLGFVEAPGKLYFIRFPRKDP